MQCITRKLKSSIKLNTVHFFLHYSQSQLEGNNEFVSYLVSFCICVLLVCCSLLVCLKKCLSKYIRTIIVIIFMENISFTYSLRFLKEHFSSLKHSLNCFFLFLHNFLSHNLLLNFKWHVYFLLSSTLT